MKHQIYVIYDQAAKIYNTPVFLINNDVAIRTVLNLVNSDSELANHPEDYTLFRIGEYDTDTAQIDNLSAPEVVARCIELKEKVNEQLHVQSGT